MKNKNIYLLSILYLLILILLSLFSNSLVKIVALTINSIVAGYVLANFKILKKLRKVISGNKMLLGEVDRLIKNDADSSEIQSKMDKVKGRIEVIDELLYFL